MGKPSIKKIFEISNDREFDELAMEIVRYQSTANPVYAEYLKLLGKAPSSIRSHEEIPFLPVEFFRQHRVMSENKEPEQVFESSGTTSGTTSKHMIPDLLFYHQHAERLFEQSFGPLEDHVTLALLPSYLERKNSSLVSMVDYFISRSEKGSGLYLDSIEVL